MVILYRNKILLFGLIFSGVFLSACANQLRPYKINPDVVISNVMVIDVTSGDRSQSDILIRDDLIIGVLPHNSTNRLNFETAEIIDGAGNFAIPGLWDMHVHISKPFLSERSLALYVANGVTNVRDMGGVWQDIFELREKTLQPGIIAPHLWIAGPIVDGIPVVFDGVVEKPAMAVGVATPAEAVALVDKLASQDVDFIKVYETLRSDVFNAITARAHYHGIPVDGHIPMRMTIMEAIASGQDGVAHMKGVDYGCSANPESLKKQRISLLDTFPDDTTGQELAISIFTEIVPKAMEQQDSANCDALIRYFAEQGTWHTPGLSTESLLVGENDYVSRWREGLRYLPETERAKKEEDELYRQKMRRGELKGTVAKFAKTILEKHDWKFDLVGKMHRAGVPLLAGTDAPYMLLPGFGLHMELTDLVKAGLSPLHALQAATINGARFFGVDDKQGSIDVGKQADILLLTGDPLLDINNTRSIDKVILNGQIIDRSALDALLTQ